MQKRHAKGFYFNSSYRRARGIRTLLHGLFQHKHEKEEGGDGDYFYSDSSSFDTQEKGAAPHEANKDMKKVAG